MSKLRFTNGNVSIAMPDVFEQHVQRVLDASIPYVQSAVGAHLDKVEDNALREAPVRTGAFRGSFRRSVSIRGDHVVFSLGNVSPYARYLKGRKQGGKNTWRTIVLLPARRALPALVEAAARDLADHVKGG